MNRIFFLIILLEALQAPALALQGAEQRADRGDRVLSLQEAVRLALARAPEASLAEAGTARAEQALKEIRAMSLPQIVTGTGLAYNNGFPLSIEGAAPSIIQVGMSQSIFSKKNRYLIQEAEEGIKASRTGLDGARNGLAAKTALIYSELHRARLAIPLLQEQKQSALAGERIAEAQLQAGRIRPLDLSLARVATANCEQLVLVARERARVAEAGLRTLTGIADGETFRTETPRIESELLALKTADLYLRTLEIHPEIRAAEATWRAHELHTEAERSERYPQLNIVSQYALFSRTNNYQDYFNRFTRNNYLLGLSIQLPLFNGFRTGARVAQSRHEAEAARLRLERMKSDLKLGLERSASDLRVAGGASELARLDLAAAEESVGVSETLLEAGRIEQKDLENARSRLIAKRIAASEADGTMFERQVMLLQASGSCAVSF